MDTLIKSRGFDVELAVKFGLNNAIFLQDLAFWIEFNRNRQQAYRDGRYWTYSTLEELVQRHPYWTKNQIRHIIDVCKKNGWITIEHYDKVSYNQRNWYSICDSVMDCLTCKSSEKESHNDMQKTTHRSETIHTSYNEEDSYNKSDKEYIPPTPQGERKPRTPAPAIPSQTETGFSDKMQEAFETWLQYKKEKKQNYQPTGLKSFVKKLKSCIEQHGEKSVIDMLEQTMANGYAGPVWNWLENQTPQKKQEEKKPKKEGAWDGFWHAGMEELFPPVNGVPRD